MKIAFIDYVLDLAQPGASGLSDVVWNMARELAKLGDDVHIIGPYTVEPEPIDGVTVHRFKLPPIGYRNIAGHILIVLAAWRVARRIPNLDAIHAPEYLTTGIIAPFSGVPVLLTTPGNIYERIAHGNPFDPLTTQVFKLAARSSARWCALIDAISDEMEEWWRRSGAKPSNLTVIPYGVDIMRFRPVDNARDILRLTSDSRVILYPGRLSPEKRVDMLIRLLPALGRNDVSLHIAGDGPLRAELESLARRLGVADHVRFLGQVALAEMPLWYSAADVVILPSTSEGLPRVMLEALACGAPFIGTRITGVVDVIRDGENGLLVDPNDDAALLAATQTMLSDEPYARRLGARAHDDIRSSYDWSSITGRLRATLERELPFKPDRAIRGAANG
jgi:glycosyltransferase involved in cell wall biosynthesis